MSDDQITRAQDLAERLRAEGHYAEAQQVQAVASGSHIGDGFLEALREACQLVLTAIEALDPKTEMMAEELRLEIDKRLRC